MPQTSDSLAASFRDPGGFLFSRGGILYRQVNRAGADDYTRFMESGLYEKLVKAGLLIPHAEVDEPPAEAALSFKILRPERAPFISYPYEWSFSQLKDAALATLSIQKRALKLGMSLKDASAYNIQFIHGRPMLIDTLSFEVYREGRPWDAYRQFCQHFLAPLALMSRVDVRLGQLLRVHIDGLPLDLASRLLPASTRLDFGLLTHIHIHAFSPPEFVEFVHFFNPPGATFEDKVRWMMSKLKEAGLDSLPGGGGEIFATPVRRKIGLGKCDAEAWLTCMYVAHSLGMFTSATMMFGHIEGYADRIHHMKLVREWQDRAIKEFGAGVEDPATGRITAGGHYKAFISWPFQRE
ncbi:MAG: hypothetical protein KJZ57_04050, partial [Anaerolineales bacterium]|nr:hypothetical protein [Anaerolineales bacterium]